MSEEATIEYSAATKKLGDKIVELTLIQAKELDPVKSKKSGEIIVASSRKTFRFGQCGP